MLSLVLVILVLFAGIHFVLSEDRDDPGGHEASAFGAGALKELIYDAQTAGLEYFGPDSLYPELRRYKQKTVLPADFVEVQMQQLPTYELQEVRKEETHSLVVKIVVRAHGVIQVLLPYTGQKPNGRLYQINPFMAVRNSNVSFLFVDFSQNGLMREYLTYLEYERGSYFLWLPFYDPEEQETYIAQIWVSEIDAEFRLGNAQQQLFARYNFFEMPLNSILPNIHYPSTRRNLRGHPYDIRAVSYILSVSWTPNACAYALKKMQWLTEEECSQGDWTIHGLWTEVRREADAHKTHNYRVAFCSQVGARRPRDVVTLDKVPNDIHHYYKTLVKHKTLETRLDFEWCKHGYKVQGIRDIEHYFNISVDLFEKLQLQQSLRMNAIDGHDFNFHNYSFIQHYFSELFETHMSGGSRRLPDFVCHPELDGYSRLYEIHFCYDTRFRPIDCDLKYYFTCRNNPKIMQPKSFHMFPNFVLTLKNIEIVDGGTSRKMKWKIENFCPTRRYSELLEVYNAYQKIHRQNMNLQLMRVLENDYQDFMANVSNAFIYEDQSQFWSQCGSLTYSAKNLPEIVSTPADYLLLAMNLYSALNTVEWPTYSHVPITREKFPFPFPKRGLFVCKRDRRRQIYVEEIRICYGTDGEMMDCHDFDLQHSINLETTEVKECPDDFYV